MSSRISRLRIALWIALNSCVAISVLFAGVALARPAAAQTGHADAGKKFWDAQMCQYCHGEKAEGAWGPDLAGRGLTAEEIEHALRQPWGLMPAYTERQVSNQTIADLQIYLSGLPKAAQFGPWRWQSPPPDAPEGQRLQSAFGCGQCHEPELGIPRRWLGGIGKDADFAYFSQQIYRHTDKYPTGRMGNFSEERLPQELLRKIYQFTQDTGLRAPVNASLAAAPPQGPNTTYTLTVFNDGVAERGLTAEDLTIFIRIPPGSKVASATGAGYKGVQLLAPLGLPAAVAITPGRFDPSKLPEHPKDDFSGDVAVWKVPRIVAAEKQTYTLTLSGAPPAEVVTLPGHGPAVSVLKGFEGSAVYWTKPGVRMGPPQLVYRDFRIPDKGDDAAVTATQPTP